MNAKDIIDFHHYSNNAFENVKSSQLIKTTKNTLKGIVELKDESKYILVVKKHSERFQTFTKKKI